MCLVVLLSYIIFVILLCKIVYFLLCSWGNIKQVCLFMALICFCNSLTCFCHQSRSFSFLHFMCVNMGQNFHGGPNVLPSSFLQIPKLWRTLKWPQSKWCPSSPWLEVMLLRSVWQYLKVAFWIHMFTIYLYCNFIIMIVHTVISVWWCIRNLLTKPTQHLCVVFLNEPAFMNIYN